MRNITAIIFQTVLIATFALWFGGFTFYVSFVVPIGNEVLESARTQGFITQQVTNWLNVVCGCASFLMLLESLRNRKTAALIVRVTQLVTALAIIAMLIGLAWLHPVMDAMIIAKDDFITDEARFYGLHRIYLWLSTFQWIAAWIWLLTTVAGWRTETTNKNH